MDRSIERAAVAILRSRDMARQAIEDHPEMRQLHSYLQGQIDAHDLGLAALAGLAGYGDRQTFERAVQTERLMDAIFEGPAPTDAAPEPMGGWEPRA